jgi:hypothetical protein
MPEEGQPFDDPPLPRYAVGGPEGRASQVGSLKSRLCFNEIQPYKVYSQIGT